MLILNMELDNESPEMLLRTLALLALTHNLVDFPLGAEVSENIKPGPRPYNEIQDFRIPALKAEEAFTRFLDMVDVKLVYIVDELKGVVLNPIQGRMNPTEAIERLVEGTELITIRDLESGTILVRHKTRGRQSVNGTAEGQVEQTNPLDRKMKTNTNTNKNWLKRLVSGATTLLLAAAPSTTNAQDNNPEAEPLFELSPFVIEESSFVGYRASQTLAGTRLNTEVRDVGAAVSVYTPEFLEDADAQKIEEILIYTTSTEGGGVNGNFSGGITSESGDEVRSNPSGTIRVRAFADATRTRDYFASDIPSDSYNFDTVTINRGPNAILAGIGAPGGIVDVALSQAKFLDTQSVSFQYGKHGTNRSELHWNKNLIDNRLAVRVDALYEDRNYRQNPASEIDKRIYTAFNWVIGKGTDAGFWGRTTLRANFEKGDINGVPPNTLTPVMSTSSWFPDDVTTATPYWRANGATRLYFDQNGNEIPRDLGNSQSATGYLEPGYTLIDGFPIFRQWAIVFNNPNTNDATVGFTDPNLSNIQGFQGTLAGGPTRGWFRGTGDWGRNPAGYFRTRLMNSDVFDFYNHLLTGSLDSRDQEFDALDIRLEQLFAHGNAGVEIAYNEQNFERFHNFPATGLSSGSNEIFIDINEYLGIRNEQYPDGIPNPNFGRPMIKSFSAFRDVINISDDESFQVTGFLRHNFEDTFDGTFAKILGEHTLTGLYFDTDRLRQSRAVTGAYTNEGDLSLTDSLGARIGTFRSQATAIWYLGEPQFGNNFSDMRIQPLTGGNLRQGDSYTLRVYDTTTDSFVTGTTTPKKVLTSYRDQLESITSEAIALQSHWLDNHLITLAGWRKDKSDSFTSVDPELKDDGNLDLSDFRLVPASSQEKESWTYSVVGVFPEEYLFELPFDSDLRFSWNESSNFNPVGQRRNQYNEEIGSPTAETEEYGLMLDILDGKFAFRVNHFETRIIDAGVEGPVNAYSYINGLISRMLSAEALGLTPSEYGYDSPLFNTFDDVARAFFDILPDRMKQNIGADKNFNPRFIETESGLTWESDNITNLASLSDIVTEGWEYEFYWNPLDNWRIAFNASKVKAVKDNLAILELMFSEEVLANSRSMFGGALVGGNRNPGQAENGAIWEDQYFNEHISNNLSQKALSGTPTPEIREWRYNILSNYDFKEGALKGISFGGSLRWIDEAAVGFPFRTVEGQQVADIANPYFDQAETRVDLNVRYRKPVTIFGTDAIWKIRLQVDNVFGKDELYTIAANPDGSAGTVRISPEPKVWSISNTIEF